MAVVSQQAEEFDSGRVVRVRLRLRGWSRRTVALAVVVVLVIVAGVVGLRWWNSSHPGPFEAALRVSPDYTKRFSFTDWAEIRSRLAVKGSAAVSNESDWISRAFPFDYTSVSTLSSTADAMQGALGFSVGNADWEAVAQSPQGNSVVLKPGDGVDLDAVARKLQDALYTKPTLANGVWEANADRLAQIDYRLPNDVLFVGLLKGAHLIVLSDTQRGAASAISAASGDKPSLVDQNGVPPMVDRVSSPIAAMTWASDFACEDLSMGKADADAQAAARDLIAQAGPVSPLSGLTMALSPQGKLTVAEQFESSSQADRNLNSRAKLATGPALGRGESTFAVDLKLDSATRDDATVLLRFSAARPGVSPLSWVYSGPVTFATC